MSVWSAQCASKYLRLLLKYPTNPAWTYVKHYTCSKPQWPLPLVSEMNFVIAVLVNKGFSFPWNFKDIMQRQYPGSPKEITRTKENTKRAKSVYVFVLCCSLEIQGLRRENLHWYVQYITLAWLILTCCNHINDLIKTHIVFQGSLKN